MSCKYVNKIHGNFVIVLLHYLRWEMGWHTRRIKNYFPFWNEYANYLTFDEAKVIKEGNGDVPFSIFHEHRNTSTGYRRNAGIGPRR